MTAAEHGAGTQSSRETASVLLYSDDYTTREKIRTATGRRASVDTPLIEWTEAATHEAVLDYVHHGDFDLLILDGETGKLGGMGLCRTLKSEVYQCPPVMVTIARAQDAWLASWSEAEAVLTYPLDPFEVQEAVAGMLREGSALSTRS
ncbi:MAG TPA: response regulator [Beutenbergiaceae bacterium]|nr:response regulator [Beutenbergiaceae bacterium]